MGGGLLADEAQRFEIALALGVRQGPSADLVAGGKIGVWMRMTWVAGASAMRPDTMTLTMAENA